MMAKYSPESANKNNGKEITPNALKTCCCFNLEPIAASKIVAGTFMIATVIKIIVLVLAYKDVCWKNCYYAPPTSISVSLAVGLIELLLYFQTAMWLIPAVQKKKAFLFMPPLVMLVCISALNVTLCVMMLIASVLLDACVRAVIAVTAAYSCVIVRKALIKVKSDAALNSTEPKLQQNSKSIESNV